VPSANVEPMRKSPLDPDEVLRSVGRRISEIRRERQMTQEQFADEAGLSWKYVQQIEAGTENLTLRSLVRLANLLHADLLAVLAKPREPRSLPGRPSRRIPKRRKE
jgi:transcriptional regulator with XRE-family HTH domain